MKTFTLTLLMVLGLFGCRSIKVVTQRPNLRRIDAHVFTDEKKLYIYIKKP